MVKIKSSYKDLINIKKGNNSFSIAQIEWWLMKYYKLFKLVTGRYNTLCDNCRILEDENLPIDCLSNLEYCNKKVEFKTFIGFYNTLDEVTQIHRLSDVLTIDIAVEILSFEISISLWNPAISELLSFEN